MTNLHVKEKGFNISWPLAESDKKILKGWNVYIVITLVKGFVNYTIYKKWAKTQGIFCSGKKKGHKKHIGTEGHKYLITCVGF